MDRHECNMNMLQCALVVVVAVFTCTVTLAVFEYGRFTVLYAQNGGSMCI